jgi:hypothetical protein
VNNVLQLLHYNTLHYISITLHYITIIVLGEQRPSDHWAIGQLDDLLPEWGKILLGVFGSTTGTLLILVVFTCRYICKKKSNSVRDVENGGFFTEIFFYFIFFYFLLFTNNIYIYIYIYFYFYFYFWITLHLHFYFHLPLPLINDKSKLEGGTKDFVSPSPLSYLFYFIYDWLKGTVSQNF